MRSHGVSCCRCSLLHVLSAWVRLLPPDDATDLLGAVPAERLTEMLDQLPPTLAAEINKLLSYDPRSGWIDDHQLFFPALRRVPSPRQIEQLRRAGKAETVFYVYVVNEDATSGRGDIYGNWSWLEP